MWYLSSFKMCVLSMVMSLSVRQSKPEHILWFSAKQIRIVITQHLCFAFWICIFDSKSAQSLLNQLCDSVFPLHIQFSNLNRTMKQNHSCMLCVELHRHHNDWFSFRAQLSPVLACFSQTEVNLRKANLID